MSHPRPPTQGTHEPPSDPFAGTSYRMLRKLGSGGAGTVYEALHVALRKRVAIKLLHRALAEAPMSSERMRLEAQALASLQSPHIVEVSDLGETADGRPFFVMELLTGASLAHVVRGRGPLAAREAVELVQQLLRGLAVAHRAGIVHRDIKLENLFLCSGDADRGTLKVLDFGIAKVLPHATSVDPPALRTGDGTILGTPRFIPPEQVRGRDVDARADLYGAGVVLYELLTGRDPFHDLDGTAPLLRAAVSVDPLPPSRVTDRSIEPALEDVVMRALAKRPEDRFESAEELSRALDRAMDLARIARRRTADPSKMGDGAPLLLACLLVLASAVLSAALTLWFTQAR